MKDTKTISELKEAFDCPQDPPTEGSSSTYEEYYIDSRKYGRLTQIKHENAPTITQEQMQTLVFIKALKKSSLPDTRAWSASVQRLYNIYAKQGTPLESTPLFTIVKEYTDKKLLISADSPEHEMLLIVATNHLGKDYPDVNPRK